MIEKILKALEDRVEHNYLAILALKKSRAQEDELTQPLEAWLESHTIHREIKSLIEGSYDVQQNTL